MRIRPRPSEDAVFTFLVLVFFIAALLRSWPYNRGEYAQKLSVSDPPTLMRAEHSQDGLWKALWIRMTRKDQTEHQIDGISSRATLVADPAKKVVGNITHEICCICLEPCKSSYGRWPNCTHILHSECAARHVWHNPSARCPVCRNSLPAPVRQELLELHDAVQFPQRVAIMITLLARTGGAMLAVCVSLVAELSKASRWASAATTCLVSLSAAYVDISGIDEGIHRCTRASEHVARVITRILITVVEATILTLAQLAWPELSVVAAVINAGAEYCRNGWNTNMLSITKDTAGIYFFGKLLQAKRLVRVVNRDLFLALYLHHVRYAVKQSASKDMYQFATAILHGAERSSRFFDRPNVSDRTPPVFNHWLHDQIKIQNSSLELATAKRVVRAANAVKALSLSLRLVLRVLHLATRTLNLPDQAFCNVLKEASRTNCVLFVIAAIIMKHTASSLYGRAILTVFLTAGRSLPYVIVLGSKILTAFNATARRVQQ